MNNQTEIALLEKELIRITNITPSEVIQFFNMGIYASQEKIKARLLKLREHL